MRMRRAWMVLGLASLPALIGLSLTTAQASASQAKHPLRGRGERPNLPEEQTYGTTNFLIHYTATGRHAISKADDDGDGIYDYVEAVAEALEYTWDVEIDQMGWAAPPPDSGEGGDERLDVYLEEVMEDGYAGYADSEGGFVGDNPNTPERERRASYSYMALDDDYAEVNTAATGETPLELMQATVAHEFNHVIQGGYDSYEPHWWLYEATATWMEDQVYDDVNDGVFYLEDVFNEPDVCLVAEQGWYANWLLLRLISERYGPDVIRQIWEHARDRDGFAAIDLALKPLGSSLIEESRDYGVAMLLRAYEEGAAYPEVFVEGDASAGAYSPDSGVQSLGVDYVRLTGAGTVTVALDGNPSILTLRAVGVRGAEADVIDTESQSLTIDLGHYNEAFILIHNLTKVDDESDCDYIDYSLTVTEGGTPSAAPTQWSAANFGDEVAEPPEEEPATEGPVAGEPYSGSGTEFSNDPTELEVPFETLLPAHLPEGYTFDVAYIMTAEEMGDNSVFYIPGGGESANFDYYDEEEHWLSIAESPSPYAGVEEWLTAIEYDSPGEIIELSGVEVLIEDLTDEEDIWHSATLILDGLFIVVDGDHTREAVLALVDGLVAAAQGAPQEVYAPTPIPEVPPTPVPDVPITPANPTAAPPVATAPPSTGTGAIVGLLTGIGLLACVGALCLSGLVVIGIGFTRGRRQR